MIHGEYRWVDAIPRRSDDLWPFIGPTHGLSPDDPPGLMESDFDEMEIGMSRTGVTKHGRHGASRASVEPLDRVRMDETTCVLAIGATDGVMADSTSAYCYRDKAQECVFRGEVQGDIDYY